MHDTGPNVDVQRLMHEIRGSVATESRPANQENSQSPGPSNGNLTAGNHYHVNDLLRFHGEDFVRNAYRALLCRDPDEAGMAHHLDGLASGRFNKIDVLASLHSSAEGRSSHVQLDGLSLPVTVRRLGRLPVVGYIIRLMVGVVRLPRLVQYQNQFEFYTWSQQKRISDSQEQHHKELNEALHQISAQILEIMQRSTEQQQANELSLRQYEELIATHHQLENVIEARLAETRKYIDESTVKLSEQISLQSQRFLDQLQQQQTDNQQLNRQFEEQLQPLLLRQRRADAELLMQERRLTVLLEQVRRNAAALPEIAADEEDHLLDPLYASFEDEFRGPRDEVRGRLQVYVPFLKDARITSGVLDIGCGRGEWLQIMNAEGIEARGLDHNRVFIEECRGNGLDVVEQDAVSYLRSVPDESLNAVTTFHLVEHLPFEILIKFVDEIVRTLKPGGMLIVETPNPQNFMVGSCNFYADPTHRNPIPSQTLQFLLEARGLGNIKVLKLRPWDAARIEGDSEIIKRFNEYFYSAPDYGIVARKP
jgi:2-polyprenyl-3-methyl-5-hydroxy-6-metoxy-1,4-benzoquinol methylase